MSLVRLGQQVENRGAPFFRILTRVPQGKGEKQVVQKDHFCGHDAVQLN